MRVSFDMPDYTVDVTAPGTIRLLEATRGLDKPVRFYQASSSKMFGSSSAPQSETIPFHPRSPYTAAKVFAHWVSINYRDAFSLFVSTGIHVQP